jgi:phosphonate degradation associated HDIG domain protein
MSLSIPEIVQLLNSRATTWYGQESVSQLEHALQCADLAEKADETPETVVAALLHDLGHMLSPHRPSAVTGEVPADVPAEALPTDTMPTKDDLHQFVALPFLRSLFPDAVLEPIKLHVDAKRYLCAVDVGYWADLSPASKHSLELQGGVFDEKQVEAFKALPFSAEAVRLRRYDDLAKVPGHPTPDLTHFEKLLSQVRL